MQTTQILSLSPAVVALSLSLESSKNSGFGSWRGQRQGRSCLPAEQDTVVSGRAKSIGLISHQPPWGKSCSYLHSLTCPSL